MSSVGAQEEEEDGFWVSLCNKQIPFMFFMVQVHRLYGNTFLYVTTLLKHEKKL